MSETLLDKSISNYNVAVMIRNQMGSDEAYLNYIGYHLQQAVELNLKYQLEMSGIEYPKTHDIDQLLRIGKENGADLLVTEYIEDHSEMFSLWVWFIKIILIQDQFHGPYRYIHISVIILHKHKCSLI